MLKKIEVEENGIRLDKFISIKCTDLSRTMIQKLIEDEKIHVNGNCGKSSLKVKQGDIVEIQDIEIKETKLKPQEIPIDIVYEDTDIIVVNKPKGLVVHPANGNPDGTLVNAIMNICKDSLSGIGGELRPGIVHRLDKDTSRINYNSKK